MGSLPAGAAEALLGMYGPVDAPEGLEDEIDDDLKDLMIKLI